MSCNVCLHAFPSSQTKLNLLFSFLWFSQLLAVYSYVFMHCIVIIKIIIMSVALSSLVHIVTVHPFVNLTYGKHYMFCTHACKILHSALICTSCYWSWGHTDDAAVATTFLFLVILWSYWLYIYIFLYIILKIFFKLYALPSLQLCMCAMYMEIALIYWNL